jgi:hypothetical protein
MAKSQIMDTTKHLKGGKNDLWRKNRCTKSKYASICSILLCLLNYEVMQQHILTAQLILLVIDRCIVTR